MEVPLPVARLTIISIYAIPPLRALVLKCKNNRPREFAVFPEATIYELRPELPLRF